MRDHAAPGGLQVLPVPGLPEFRPGDDLAAALAAAAPWLADGDVVVVTSKIVSKVEGRLVAAPADPDARDALRRERLDRSLGHLRFPPSVRGLCRENEKRKEETEIEKRKKNGI